MSVGNLISWVFFFEKKIREKLDSSLLLCNYIMCTGHLFKTRNGPNVSVYFVPTHRWCIERSHSTFIDLCKTQCVLKLYYIIYYNHLKNLVVHGKQKPFVRLCVGPY